MEYERREGVLALGVVVKDPDPSRKRVTHIVVIQANRGMMPRPARP